MHQSVMPQSALLRHMQTSARNRAGCHRTSEEWKLYTFKFYIWLCSYMKSKGMILVSLRQRFSYMCLLLTVLLPFPCCLFCCLEHSSPSSCPNLFLLLTADTGSRFLLLFLPSTTKYIFCFLLEQMSRGVDPVWFELLPLLYHKPSAGSQCCSQNAVCPSVSIWMLLSIRWKILIAMWTLLLSCSTD